MGQHGADEIGRAFLLEDGVQGVGGPVGIPEGKYRVLLVAFRPVHFQIGTAILPVDVGEEVRRQEGVVQGGIEGPPLGFGTAGQFHLRQHFPPFVLCRPADRIERPARRIGVEVATGALHRHGRDAHFYLQFGLAVEFETQGRFDALVFQTRSAIDLRTIAEQPQTGDRFGETRHEVEVLLLRPGPRNAVALQLVVAHPAQEGAGRFVAMLQVENDVDLAPFGEAVAMIADAFAGGQLDLNVVIFEEGRVVARLGRFAFLGKGGSIARLAVGAIVDARFARGRHEQHIGVVGDTGTAQVRMAESVHHGVGIVIARAAIPAGQPRVGT